MIRQCPECEKDFETRGRNLTCSPECAAKRLQRQLTAVNERRRVHPGGLKVVCRICKKHFQARNKTQRYCSPEHKVAGLQLAVERQRKRRAQMKRLNESGK